MSTQKAPAPKPAPPPRPIIINNMKPIYRVDGATNPLPRK